MKIGRDYFSTEKSSRLNNVEFYQILPGLIIEHIYEITDFHSSSLEWMSASRKRPQT